MLYFNTNVGATLCGFASLCALARIFTQTLRAAPHAAPFPYRLGGWLLLLKIGVYLWGESLVGVMLLDDRKRYQMKLLQNAPGLRA